MTGWWIADLMATPNGKVLVVSWLVWVVVSITLHELAHGWAALRLGDDTPIRAGHMTWNPIVHMGPYSLVALLLIGIAWGAMPVDPSRLRGKYADTIVAIAGPLINLAIAFVLLVLLILWEPFAEGHIFSGVNIQDPLKANMIEFLHAGAFLNIVLLMFNLLPTPPLDGGRVLMNICPPFRRLMVSEHGQWFGLGIFILFFMFAAPVLFVVSKGLVFVITDVAQSILFPSMS